MNIYMLWSRAWHVIQAAGLMQTCKLGFCFVLLWCRCWRGNVRQRTPVSSRGFRIRVRLGNSTFPSEARGERRSTRLSALCSADRRQRTERREGLCARPLAWQRADCRIEPERAERSRAPCKPRPLLDSLPRYVKWPNCHGRFRSTF